MNLPDSFADFPVSVAELRSDRTRNCADWTPRDCLIDLLRQIDSGKAKPDTLVIAYAEHNGSATSSFYSAAAPNVIAALGILTRAVHRIQVCTDDD